MNNVPPTEAFAKPVSVAFMLGASDAEAGDSFCPEKFFVRSCDKIQYSLGWEMVRGASEMTRQFTHSVNWGAN
jgi:hypothetical protein